MTVAAEACPMMPWASMTGHISVATMLCRDDMPASVHHYRCLPGRDMGELGARVGMDGWTMVAAISAPNCWMTCCLGGRMINCYLDLCLPPLASPSGDMVIDHWSQSFKLIWSNLDDW